MNRLRTRLVLSHLVVAVLGGLATFLVVRLLTPLIFDRQMGLGGGQGGPGTGGQGYREQLNAEVTNAVTQALAVGLAVGVLAAAAAGVFAAARLARPLHEMSEATRRIAAGDYEARVTPPRESELAALAEDVNTLGSALAETEQRRTRLLGEVAHEMRTPLTIIDGHVEGMIDGILPATPEELGKVSDEARRLRRLSDDLSALSRAEEGRLVLASAPADLRSVVSGAAERLRSQADDAGIRLTVSAGEQAVPVDVDADRIAEVVTNLVGNAMRATARGGAIDVRVGAESEGAVVAVADTGEGIAPEDLERVFERFYRVPGRRADGSGSGIGLTIARGIVRAHGGELTARSEGRGQGATFTVRMPLRADAASTSGE
ncbi:sensor histidine kinase [Microbacterium thalassium]|uniref:histidine kinase n=1 Tax=Microbacterium thalassium TaxID=362649 RepID=A0A7X0KTA6_9MICO|nr:HAMP domain-containing sensor histidine kinase [Microbacterium thalassium]MBB6389853.1 histidine kinase [Microbacterium thalassium]GLK24540.1 two-component sensor histidine kinase [Microbacterium thalassium]